jgi:hypothetical protein
MNFKLYPNDDPGTAAKKIHEDWENAVSQKTRLKRKKIANQNQNRNRNQNGEGNPNLGRNSSIVSS